MSFPSPVPGQPQPAPVASEPTERVGLGLLAAAVAVVGGVVLTVVIWRAGFIASITALAIAFGAAFLYEAAAGRGARKGLVPLLLLVVVGIVLAFFAIVASDAYDVYGDLGLENSGISRATFIREAMLEPEVLKEYGKETALFLVFGVVGIIGVGRRLFGAR